MKALHLLIPVFLIMVSGCKILKKQSDVEVKTGMISLKEVKKYKWFRQEYRNYKIKKEVADSIKIMEKCEIVIFGGEWCGDTKEQLPRFIKILKHLHFKTENIIIIMVDRKKECPNCGDYNTESFDINFVPSFIILEDQFGKEIGRIVETPKKSLEEDLLKIIATKTQNH